MRFVTTSTFPYRLFWYGCVLLLSGLLCVAGEQDDIDRLYRTGRQALAKQQTTRARELFNEVLRADPEHQGARLNLGITWAREQRWDEAEQVYRELLRNRPDHPQGNNNLGNLFFRQGRYDEAEPFYRAAIASKEDYLLAWFHLGWIYRHDNRLDRAAKAFERCLQIEPRSNSDAVRQIDAQYYLGTVHYRLRNFEGCRRAMQVVLEMRPNHLEANYQMAQALIRLGRREESTPYLERHRKLLKERSRRQPVASGMP